MSQVNSHQLLVTFPFKMAHLCLLNKGHTMVRDEELIWASEQETKL